jgi:dehydrogenase/reductase SDR family member 1
MSDLRGVVAVVTGASRGIGKGIAVGLGEAGATVYLTGRSSTASPGVLPGTVELTAEQVSAAGGHGVAVRCDHRDDGDVAALFERVLAEHGHLDVLVNNAFGSPPQRVLWGGQRFWEIPFSLWDDLIDVGLRSHFVAAAHAARMMVERGSGLVVNVASHVAGSGKTARSRVILPYSVGKAGLHRLTADMAAELTDRGVAVIEIWPPATLTEGILDQPDVWDTTGWKEPIRTGRVLASWVAAGDWLARSGQTVIIEDLATELGVSQA